MIIILLEFCSLCLHFYANSNLTPFLCPLWIVYLLCCFIREAASNFLTALSLQRKSQSHQQSHQVMSGNIWAALRIALSMMDQPELFQAANIGDLDLLMRAFNLDIWRAGVSDDLISPLAILQSQPI